MKPFSVNPNGIYQDFNPADPNLNRSAVVEYMRKVALQSSQNLKRNADAFLSTYAHDNDKLIWSRGKRTQSDKFALTY